MLEVTYHFTSGQSLTQMTSDNDASRIADLIMVKMRMNHVYHLHFGVDGDHSAVIDLDKVTHVTVKRMSDG